MLVRRTQSSLARVVCSRVRSEHPRRRRRRSMGNCPPPSASVDRRSQISDLRFQPDGLPVKLRLSRCPRPAPSLHIRAGALPLGHGRGQSEELGGVDSMVTSAAASSPGNPAGTGQSCAKPKLQVVTPSLPDMPALTVDNSGRSAKLSSSCIRHQAVRAGQRSGNGAIPPTGVILRSAAPEAEVAVTSLFSH
jgi:hypothetical protein